LSLWDDQSSYVSFGCFVCKTSDPHPCVGPLLGGVWYIGTTRPPIGRVCTAEPLVLFNIITSLNTRTRNPFFATHAHALNMYRVKVYNRYRSGDGRRGPTREVPKNPVTAAQTLPSSLPNLGAEIFLIGPMHTNRKLNHISILSKSESWIGGLILILY